MLLADGFEEAFIGYSNNGELKAVYDYAKCIQILQKDMSYEEAIEYFEYNVIGAYMGKHTPIFMTASSVEEFSEVVEETC